MDQKIGWRTIRWKMLNMASPQSNVVSASNSARRVTTRAVCHEPPPTQNCNQPALDKEI